MFGLGPKPLVGLDVGSSCVKAVELEKRGSGLALAQCAVTPLLPDGETPAGRDVEASAATVARLFEQARIKHHATATAVSGNAVIVKRISLPAMSDYQLAETIHQEAARHLPFDLQEVNLDYQILHASADGQLMDVLLVAVRKEKVARVAQIVSLAHQHLRILDVDTLALGNCYEYNYRPQPNDVAALLNLGAGTMNLNIMKGGAPLFPRDVSVGGSLYNAALCRELSVSAEDGEALKRGETVDGVTSEQAHAVLQQVTEIVILEVHKTLDFFRASEAAEPIERLYLSGGCAPVPGLLDALRQDFAMPVELLNPFLNLAISSRHSELDEISRNPGQWAVAVGLALRNWEPS
jgi:type IV pilus assembly protein PilM